MGEGVENLTEVLRHTLSLACTAIERGRRSSTSMRAEPGARYRPFPGKAACRPNSSNRNEPPGHEDTKRVQETSYVRRQELVETGHPDFAAVLSWALPRFFASVVR